MIGDYDSRYPYTYAADMIRCVVGGDVSRSSAAQLITHIAQALGYEREALAQKLADHFKANEKLLTEIAIEMVIQSMGGIEPL